MNLLSHGFKEYSVIFYSVGFPGDAAGPALGLIPLAELLRRKGLSVSIVCTTDPSFAFPASIDRDLCQRKRIVVGISTTSNAAFSAYRIADYIKKHYPHIPVLMGGAHPTTADITTLNRCSADIVVRGEADHIIVDLIQRIALDNHSWKTIPGLTYRSDDGEVIRTPRASVPIDLSTLPAMNWDVVASGPPPYKLGILGCRGCPYDCSFCANRVVTRKYRLRPIEQIKQEVVSLVELQKGSASVVRFFDDSFASDYERVVDLCEFFEHTFDCNHDFFWVCGCCVSDLARNSELIPRMKKAGLARILLGVESGNPSLQKAYGKRIDLEDLYSVVRACTQNRILSYLTFIIGGPHETEETLRDTERVMLRLLDDSEGYVGVASGYLMPYPGTAIAKDPGRYGIKVLDPELMTATGLTYCVCETDSLSKYQLVSLRARISKAVLAKMLANSMRLKDSERKWMGLLASKGLPLVQPFIEPRNCSAVPPHKQTLAADEAQSAEDNDFFTPASLSIEEIWDCVPYRMPSWVDADWRAKTLILSVKTGPVRLDPLESRCWELSAGKLSVCEQFERLKEECRARNAADRLVAFYQRMTNHGLLRFRHY